jgi:hypothetical protein
LTCVQRSSLKLLGYYYKINQSINQTTNPPID